MFLDQSNFDKWWSGVHFLSFLSYYYCKIITKQYSSKQLLLLYICPPDFQTFRLHCISFILILSNLTPLELFFVLNISFFLNTAISRAHLFHRFWPRGFELISDGKKIGLIQEDLFQPYCIGNGTWYRLDGQVSIKFGVVSPPK